VLKRRLTKEEIHDLSLIVASKADANNNLKNYEKSVEFFKKLNEEYKKENPPRITFLK
jgi:phospholipid N-methyltransferase